MSRSIVPALSSSILLVFAAAALAQGPSPCAARPGCAGGTGAAHGPGCAHHGAGHDRGMAMNATADHAADMEVFHFLLDQGARIRRTVTTRPDGVETLTESDDPGVAEKIRLHVASMYDRVEEGRPIHQRDPLFREVFAHADKIRFTNEATDKGVRVIQTSTDPHVVALVQAHAAVVSKFIANGRAEARVDHEVPGTPR